MTTRPGILFVCLGNICRSPLAEGVMRKGFGKFFAKIDSAGTANYHIGEPPDQRMQETARRHGIDLSSLRGRQIDDADCYEFDFIVAMDSANLRSVRERARSLGNATARIEKFLAEGDVPDPYFGGTDGFEENYRIVESGCEPLLRRLGIL